MALPSARAIRLYARKALGSGWYPLLSLMQLSELELNELKNLKANSRNFKNSFNSGSDKKIL
jgi:hypothetical protein